MVSAEIRAEISAMDTILIEAFWLYLEQLIAAERGRLKQGVVRPFKNQAGLLEIRGDFKFIEDYEVYNKISENPFENIWLLRDGISALTTSALLMFVELLEKDSKNEAYLKLRELLATESLSGGLERAYWVVAHIHKGLNTGVFATFDALRILPLAFAEATNRIMSETEFRSCAQKSQVVLTSLASMELQSFVKLRESTRKHYPETLPPARKANDYEFPREFFVFSEESGQLLLNPEHLQRWRADNKNSQTMLPVRRGCPARLSKGGATSNVVLKLYDLQINIFIKYLVPHMKSYVESGRVK